MADTDDARSSDSEDDVLDGTFVDNDDDDDDDDDDDELRPRRYQRGKSSRPLNHGKDKANKEDGGPEKMTREEQLEREKAEYERGAKEAVEEAGARVKHMLIESGMSDEAATHVVGSLFGEDAPAMASSQLVKENESKPLKAMLSLAAMTSGSAARSAEAPPRKNELKVGDRLEAKWRNGELWYEGVIAKVHKRGGAVQGFDVHYDDGGKEQKVDIANVRCIGAEDDGGGDGAGSPDPAAAGEISGSSALLACVGAATLDTRHAVLRLTEQMDTLRKMIQASSACVPARSSDLIGEVALDPNFDAASVKAHFDAQVKADFKRHPPPILCSRTSGPALVDEALKKGWITEENKKSLSIAASKGVCAARSVALHSNVAQQFTVWRRNVYRDFVKKAKESAGAFFGYNCVTPDKKSLAVKRCVDVFGVKK